jgi:hypothetical protein
MTQEVWFFVLICVSGSCTPGMELPPRKPNYEYAFSKQSCEQYAFEMAQAMFVTDGSKWGYRCKQVDYQPPNLDKQP